MAMEETMCRKARSSILQPGAICNVPAEIEVGDSKPINLDYHM